MSTEREIERNTVTYVEVMGEGCWWIVTGFNAGGVEVREVDCTSRRDAERTGAFMLADGCKKWSFGGVTVLSTPGVEPFGVRQPGW